MYSKRWIKLVLVISIFNMTCLGLVNYIVDPFNIFHSPFFSKQFQENERFLKLEYLEKNHVKYNAYMFGSSRVGTTNPKLLEEYVPGSKFYNLSVQNANLYDQLMHLRYFIKNKYIMNTLYLQLDLTDMSSYGNDGTRYLVKLHPYVADESLFMFYAQYLTGLFYTNIIEKLKLNFSDKKYDKTVDITTGYWQAPLREKRISESCDSYVNNEQSFKISTKKAKEYKLNTNAQEALKEIKKLCQDNKIKLYVLLTATNQNSMNLLEVKSYIDILKAIAKITDFYDFSGYNTITKNNCNFYDFAHYRPNVGRLIVERIFNHRVTNISDGFGFYVNKNNIDEYSLVKTNEADNYRLREMSNAL